MRNAGLEEAQAGLKIAGRNINKLRYAHDTTLMAESEEELNTLKMKVKEESGGGHCTWEEPAQFSVVGGSGSWCSRSSLKPVAFQPTAFPGPVRAPRVEWVLIICVWGE